MAYNLPLNLFICEYIGCIDKLEAKAFWYDKADVYNCSLNRPRGKESTEVQKSQINYSLNL